MMNKGFVIDWDGTCVTDSWPAMGTWLNDAPESLHRLTRLGRVRISSCRIAPFEPDEITPRPLALVQAEKDAIRQMLDEAGLHMVPLFDGPYKPSADEYIDNNGRRFPGRPGSWKKMVEMMEGLYGGKR